MSEKMLNTRIQQKHDIEVNWSKAVNFIPKIGEIIVYDPDDNHAAARIKIGDGVKTVIELDFIDDAVKNALFKEIDMVDEKVEALGQLVGDASIPEQIEEALLKTQADWNESDKNHPAYVKNRTHYDSRVVLEWDGDDSEKIIAKDSANRFNYVKISDMVIGKEPLPYTIHFAAIDGSNLKYDISAFETIDDHIDFAGYAVCILKDDLTLDWDGVGSYITFPEKGFYFTKNKVFYVNKLEFGKLKQLDPKFIPTATEDQLINLLMEIDAFPAMTDKNGSVFTHNDSILLI